MKKNIKGNLKYIRTKYNWGINDVMYIGDELETNVERMQFVKLVSKESRYYIVPCNDRGICTLENISESDSLESWLKSDIQKLFKSA